MDLFVSVLYTVFVLLLIAAPFILGKILVTNWLKYVRLRSFVRQDTVLLELKLPKEITRSPVGMELILTALWQTGAASYHETFWQGKIRPTFSLELVSDGGTVHFYIWAKKNWRNVIEAQIYSQYPNIEVYEVEDYTKSVFHDLNKFIMWGTIFIKSTKKHNAYPIKTYIDYGLDQDPKEEFKIDPMTSVLEYLGSLRKGEKTWIQIIIQAHKKEGKQEGRWKERPDWSDGIAKEVEAVRERTTKKVGEFTSFPNPTKGDIEVIAALERSQSKLPFEVIIRGIYMANNDIGFNAHNGLAGLIGSFRQYSSRTLNEIKLGKFTDFGDTGKDMISIFGWIPFFKSFMRGIRNEMEIRFLNLYKRRYAFMEPFEEFNPKPIIMTTEELATVYHFPGQVATTPTIGRSASKKAEPPPNLPI